MNIKFVFGTKPGAERFVEFTNTGRQNILQGTKTYQVWCQEQRHMTHGKMIVIENASTEKVDRVNVCILALTGMSTRSCTRTRMFCAVWPLSQRRESVSSPSSSCAKSSPQRRVYIDFPNTNTALRDVRRKFQKQEVLEIRRRRCHVHRQRAR